MSCKLCNVNLTPHLTSFILMVLPTTPRQHPSLIHQVKLFCQNIWPGFPQGADGRVGIQVCQI